MKIFIVEHYTFGVTSVEDLNEVKIFNDYETAKSYFDKESDFVKKYYNVDLKKDYLLEYSFKDNGAICKGRLRLFENELD